jgi:hypothetical protein
LEEQTDPFPIRFWTQAELLHVKPAPQTWPHAPQLFTLFVRLVSQPSAITLLQSPKPALQERIVQPPFMHAAVALGMAHAMQATPPVPQETAVGGLIQVLPLQQPVGQDTALQDPAVLHEPLMQLCPGAHAKQAAPPVPQAVELGVVQVFPLQQPVGHDVASQVGGAVHEPFTQLCPAAHATQATPAVPQALAVDAVQVFPLQQPVGQDTALQDPEALHEPFTQLCPGAHARQTAPPVPQALKLGGVQVPPLQQPVGHDVASQLLPEPQVPLAHGTPLAQALPQLPQLEGSDEEVVQMPPHDVPEQESVSPEACILYSTSRFASAPVVEAHVEPVRSEACNVEPAAKVNTMGPLSDQYCAGVSARSCPLAPSVKRNTAAGQPAPVGVLAVAAMRNTVIA